MFEIIVMLIVLLTMAISCWWLEDFHKASAEEQPTLESQPMDAVYDVGAALQTHSIIGD